MIAAVPIVIALSLLSCAWLVGSLPRLLRDISRGRDQRTGGVTAPLWKRLALRAGLFGLAAGGALGVCSVWLFELHLGDAVLSASIAGVFGAMLGLVASLEVAAQGAVGSSWDEVGASISGGLFAAFSLVALRVLLRYGISLLAGNPVHDAWTDGLAELREAMLGRTGGSFPAVLTQPVLLAVFGFGFGLALFGRLSTLVGGWQAAVLVICVGSFLAGLLIRELGPCGFSFFAIPLGLLFAGGLELCARLERWRWAPPPLPLDWRPRAEHAPAGPQGPEPAQEAEPKSAALLGDEGPDPLDPDDGAVGGPDQA
ncbi:MAG: hypothetical protein AB7N76_06195 [Planctomycetota bacterium]